MTSQPATSRLFLIAAAYDGIIGLAFLLRGEWLFSKLDTTPPNHFGYIQFPAALLLVFTLMFLAVARDPKGNRDLIPYGILLKVSYCGVVFFHWFSDGIPWIWKPFVICDLVFLVLFVKAYSSLGKKVEQES